jgi:hypothetical protein
MIGWLVNDGFERMLMEAVVAKCKALSWHLAGGTHDKHKSLRVVSVQVEIRNGYLQNTIEKTYRFSQLSQWEFGTCHFVKEQSLSLAGESDGTLSYGPESENERKLR